MGWKKKYVVKLDETSKSTLEALVSTGHHSSSEILHAHILLKADAAWPNVKICATFSISEQTVIDVKRDYLSAGLDSAIYRKVRKAGPRPFKLDGEQESRLIALSCSSAPEGHSRWTLRLLKEHLIQLEVVDNISPETVRRVLKKTCCTPTKT